MISKKLGMMVLPIAGLLACGVAREVHDDGSGGGNCTACHGDPARSGAALAQAAPADAAHVAHVERNGLACSTCHVVPTSMAHANGTVDVVFGPAALADGAQPTFSGGTCSGVYCHGGTLGAGGKSTTLPWAGGALACDACHGAPPPSHAAASTTCSACHPGTVKPDGTIDVAGGLHANGRLDGGTGTGHPAGWSDPAQHGLAAKGNLASCQACHGVSFSGGTSGVSCNACHGGAAWISNCTFCHGTKLATYTGGDLSRAAPPRGTRGETATTARAVGAHQRHLTGGSLGGPVACTECHAVPTDLSHLDGSPAVAFGTAASRGTTPAWNGLTCASTYCHGATIAGGTNKAPGWTGGSTQAACGTCHGVPPPAPHTTSTACGSCHDGYGPTTVNAALHMNGTVDRLSGATHAAGWAAKDQHGYEVTRTGLASCKGCHGANLTGGAGPSCGSCHAGGGTAWATSCTFCHGDRVSGRSSPPVDTQGRTATTNVSVGTHASHVGTTLMAGMACTQCHADRSASNVITDAAHVDGDGVAEVTFGALARTGGAPATYARTSATAATCASTYCHGRFTGGSAATMSWTSATPAGCTTCHGIAPSTGRHSKHVVSEGLACSVCHPGYTASSVTAATHIDGVKQVGGSSNWNPTSRSCSNGCHGSKNW